MAIHQIVKNQIGEWPIKILSLANPNAYLQRNLTQFGLDQIILIWRWPYPFIRTDSNPSFKNIDAIFELTLVLIINRPCLTIGNLMIVESGEWPWPFTKIETSESANGHIQKLAIHFEFGHSLILAIRWSGPLYLAFSQFIDFFRSNIILRISKK